MANLEQSTADLEENYNSLRRLIPELAQELDGLRASLREHNAWLQRYGDSPQAPYTAFSSSSPFNQASVTAATASTIDSLTTSRGSSKTPPRHSPESSATTTVPVPAPQEIEESSNLPPPIYPTTQSVIATASTSNPSQQAPAPPPPDYAEPPSAQHPASPHTPTPPSYSASSSSSSSSSAPQAAAPEPDVLPSYGNRSPSPPPFTNPPPTLTQMQNQRDQTIEWLREGEDVLREYSATFAQLSTVLDRPYEDVLHTWRESDVDNALPDYTQIENNVDLMVGGVRELPPDYIGRDGSPGGAATTTDT